jgi:GDP-L-fucose synthase
MEKSSRIYVAGHTGLFGSAIVARLRSQEYGNLILRSHSELDLTNQAAVRKFFEDAQPEYVFVAAARVGGILANSSRPADFISDNLLIAVNAVTESHRASVKRLLFLGSSCIYPRMARQPLTENAWLTGPLEPTNRPYAIAKIAGVEMCWSFNRQFGTHYIGVMPTNLYGPRDNYDPDGSHLIPALIRKLHDAKVRGMKEVVIWGTGTPKREFLYSEDAADASVFLANLPDAAFEGIVTSEPPILNVGSGSELTIVEVAEMVRETVDVNVTFKFDQTKPDGTPRKLLDSSRINALGWRATTPLGEGLRLSYQSFLSSGLGSAQRSSLVQREPLTV